MLLISSVSVVFAKNARMTANDEVAAPSELYKKFLNETKIELGEYVRTPDSPESCLDGELVLKDVSEPPGTELNLMLGARSLAGSLGREKYKETEDGCENVYETTYNDVAIKARTEQICSGFKKIYHTTINLSKGKLSYVQELYEEDKLIDTGKCTIVKKEATAPVKEVNKTQPPKAKTQFKKVVPSKKK